MTKGLNITAEWIIRIANKRPRMTSKSYTNLIHECFQQLVIYQLTTKHRFFWTTGKSACGNFTNQVCSSQKLKQTEQIWISDYQTCSFIFVPFFLQGFFFLIPKSTFALLNLLLDYLQMKCWKPFRLWDQLIQ